MEQDSKSRNLQRSDVRHPKIFEVTKATISQLLEQNKKLDAEHLFLHIPKTGGSSFFDFISANKKIFEKVPTPLFHTWTAQLALEYLPKSKLIFFIRDPLERVVSGYQSRSRMGLPKYHVPWRPEEATAFALFPTVYDFINGLKSRDERDIAATKFAMDNIMAIRWNYKHYFNSVESIDKMQGSFMVYRLDNCDEAISDLLEKGILRCNNCSSARSVINLYPRSHSSKKKSSELINNICTADRKSIEEKLSEEYAIFNRLAELCCSR